MRRLGNIFELELGSEIRIWTRALKYHNFELGTEIGILDLECFQIGIVFDLEFVLGFEQKFEIKSNSQYQFTRQ